MNKIHTYPADTFDVPNFGRAYVTDVTGGIATLEQPFADGGRKILSGGEGVMVGIKQIQIAVEELLTTATYEGLDEEIVERIQQFRADERLRRNTGNDALSPYRKRKE